MLLLAANANHEDFTILTKGIQHTTLSLIKSNSIIFTHIRLIKIQTRDYCTVKLLPSHRKSIIH